MIKLTSELSLGFKEASFQEIYQELPKPQSVHQIYLENH